MTFALRVLAVLMAVVAVVDPALSVHRPAAVPVEILVPEDGTAGFAEASAIRETLLARVDSVVRADGPDAPRAIVAIGNVQIEEVPDAPVFVVSLDAPSGVTSTSASSVHVWWGQQPRVTAPFRGWGMQGRTTTFTLTSGSGAVTATAQHRWTQDDERFEPSFDVAAPQPGMNVVRIGASGEGIATPQSVDIPVVVEDRRARVLVFEPRPSWATSFARQALEADPLFDVQALARTSRGVTTHTPGVPDALGLLDPDAVEAIVVGGLEVLGERDLAFLRRFVEERGGTLVLAPDARVPDEVRRVFTLPATEETLLERPAELRQGGVRLQATELLRIVDPSAGVPTSPLIVVPHGRGQVLVSVALDAWRFRGERSSGFSRFWRATMAQAAMAAMPPASLTVEPLVARPGSEVAVRVKLRAPTGDDRGDLELPRGALALVAAGGRAEPLRLWPGTSADEYVATFPAPAPGRYDIRVDLEGLPRRDAVLVVDDKALSASRDRSSELAFVAEATGGAAFAGHDIEAVSTALRAIPKGDESRQLHPARSVWWMVGWTGLLCAEWTLRRRRGLR